MIFGGFFQDCPIVAVILLGLIFTVQLNSKPDRFDGLRNLRVRESIFGYNSGQLVLNDIHEASYLGLPCTRAKAYIGPSALATPTTGLVCRQHTNQFPKPQKQKGQPLRGQPLVVPHPPRERGGVIGLGY